MEGLSRDLHEGMETGVILNQNGDGAVFPAPGGSGQPPGKFDLKGENGLGQEIPVMDQFFKEGR